MCWCMILVLLSGCNIGYSVTSICKWDFFYPHIWNYHPLKFFALWNKAGLSLTSRRDPHWRLCLIWFLSLPYVCICHYEVRYFLDFFLVTLSQLFPLGKWLAVVSLSSLLSCRISPIWKRCPRMLAWTSLEYYCLWLSRCVSILLIILEDAFCHLSF